MSGRLLNSEISIRLYSVQHDPTAGLSMNKIPLSKLTDGVPCSNCL